MHCGGGTCGCLRVGNGESNCGDGREGEVEQESRESGKGWEKARKARVRKGGWHVGLEAGAWIVYPYVHISDYDRSNLF